MGRIADSQRSRNELLAELQQLRSRLRAVERGVGGRSARFLSPVVEKVSTHAAEADERRYRSVADSDMFGVVFSEAGTGLITEANDAFLRLLGHDRRDVESHPLHWDDLTPPHYIPIELLIHTEIIRSGTAAAPRQRELLHRDGRAVPVLIRAAFADERRSTIVCCVLDITDRKRQEEELHRAKLAAEAANQAKDEFLAMLSHELRTPLTPVLMGLSELSRRSELPGGVRDELAVIHRDVQLEARLIDDLLDLTRIAHGKLELRQEPLDVHGVIQQALRTCEDEAGEKAVTFHVDCSAAPSLVRADPARLQQVFWNLIKNAVKFTPRGGDVTIRTLLTPGDSVRVEIADTGIGIEPVLLPRVFDPFEQGDRSITRRFGGLGLGLAICKGIAHMHGGQISVASAGPGKGSTFAVELPLYLKCQLDDAVAARPAAAVAIRPLRILLVEDHQSTADLLARLLGDSGHSVVSTDCVAGALRQASLQGFDLLISDLGLPDGDGNQLMRTLHELYRVPGIALSGYGQPDDLRRSMEAGFRLHLVKPVDLPQLEEAIRRVMS